VAEAGGADALRKKGDIEYTYLLYINPTTWRVDQFLFTVLDFGRTDPLLMEVEYERVEGVLLPVRRRYTPSDWAGKVPADAQWTDEISLGIRFDNGFGAALFAAPGRWAPCQPTSGLGSTSTCE